MTTPVDIEEDVKQDMHNLSAMRQRLSRLQSQNIQVDDNHEISGVTYSRDQLLSAVKVNMSNADAWLALFKYDLENGTSKTLMMKFMVKALQHVRPESGLDKYQSIWKLLIPILKSFDLSKSRTVFRSIEKADWNKTNAYFYSAWAHMEINFEEMQAAVKVLQLGWSRKAEPKERISRMITDLKGRFTENAPIKKAKKHSQENSTPMVPFGHTQENTGISQNTGSGSKYMNSDTSQRMTQDQSISSQDSFHSRSDNYSSSQSSTYTGQSSNFGTQSQLRNSGHTTDMQKNHDDFGISMINHGHYSEPVTRGPEVNRKDYRMSYNESDYQDNNQIVGSTEVINGKTSYNFGNIRDVREFSSPLMILDYDKNVVQVNGHSYIRLNKVGSGGSSKVYKVLGEDGSIYALKRVDLQHADDLMKSEYLEEISLLERLRQYDCIIQLIDSEINEEEKMLNIILEFAEIDFASMLNRHRGSMYLKAENYMRLYWHQMVEAVRVIHENERIVHSDLKPQNFVSVLGRLKLIDFGIAKAIESHTTNIQRDNIVGTLCYMAPEAFNQKNNGTKKVTKLARSSDIWALGCILYQMVYGKPPLSSLNTQARVMFLVNPNEHITFPPICGKPIPDDLTNVLSICLRRDPSQRPTAHELLMHPFLHPFKYQEKLKKQNRTSSNS